MSASAAMPVQPTLGERSILALDGRIQRISELWEDGSTVLVFLRHFG